MGSESSGFEQTPRDVVGQVPEAEGGAAQVFEPPVDGLGGAVAGAGPVEEREDVRGALLQGAAELVDLDERRGDAGGDGIDHGLHHLLALVLVWFAVGGDDALVDAPGRFHFDVLLRGEQRGEPIALLVSEEATAGMQCAASLVERVPGAASMPERGLLDPLPAPVQAIAGEADHVEGIHDRDRGGGLEAGEPVHRDHLDLLAPFLRAAREPVLEHGLRTTLDHVQQPSRSRFVPIRGEVDDHRDVLVTLPRVPPDMLVDADRGDPVEPCRVIDQLPLPFSEDRTVRRGPGHAQPGGDAGHREVVEDEARQPPGQPTARDLRPLRRGLGRVLAPHPPAPGALVPTHPDQQRRRPMPERFMRKPTRHRVASHALASALATPAIRFSDATLDDRTIRLHDLPDGLKTELIESAERGQGGRGEGSVEHVEVFRMGSAGTSILVETSTPTRPPTRSGDYTLDREEPDN